MSNYRNRRNYENLERRIFDGVGEYGIPEIQPTPYEGGCEWISFNYAKSCEKREGKGVHFLWMITNLTACGRILIGTYPCCRNSAM